MDNRKEEAYQEIIARLEAQLKEVKKKSSARKRNLRDINNKLALHVSMSSILQQEKKQLEEELQQVYNVLRKAGGADVR
jgi:hypothetical protein